MMFERQAAVKTKHMGLRLIVRVKITFSQNVSLGHTFLRKAVSPPKS